MTPHEMTIQIARACKLFNNLRRFAAEHGGALNMQRAKRVIGKSAGYGIMNNTDSPRGNRYKADSFLWSPIPAYFATAEACEQAIEAFRNEIDWYMTEYDPMPEGWWDE